MNSNDYIRISQVKPAGFGWPERVVGVLITALILIIAVAFGLLILGVVAAGALVLAARIWWWRRRLRQSNAGKPVIIDGEYRVLQSRRGADRES